jgi:hypothetical protein
MKAPVRFLMSVMLSASLASAQQHTVPVQPQYGSDKRDGDAVRGSVYSGYDPFHLDWSSGQFIYVPRPYESFDIHGPFHFNPSSGRFDYVPTAPPPAPDYWPPVVRGDGSASNYLDTRMDLQSRATTASATITNAPSAPQPPSVKAWTVTVPAAPAIAKGSTTKPAAANAWQAAAKAQLKGRWEYNPENGRWRCVLPGDN